MKYKKNNLNKIIGLIIGFIGIVSFFSGLVFADNINGWLTIIYPLSIAIMISGIGFMSNGLIGCGVLASWVLIFFGSLFLLNLLAIRFNVQPMIIRLFLELALSISFTRFFVKKTQKYL